jgi:hypothetical protein
MHAFLTNVLALWLAITASVLTLLLISEVIRHLRTRIAIARMTAAAQRYANSGRR